MNYLYRLVHYHTKFVINPKLRITYLDLPQDDPLQRKPVIDLARKNLNWDPRIELSEGLDLTIEYFKRNLKL